MGDEVVDLGIGADGETDVGVESLGIWRKSCGRRRNGRKGSATSLAISEGEGTDE